MITGRSPPSVPANAFPGLVLGYFLAEDGATCVSVYGRAFGLAAASALIGTAIILGFRIPRRVATPASPSTSLWSALNTAAIIW